MSCELIEILYTIKLKNMANFALFLCRINVSSEFKKIQEAADLVDITFSCDGKQFGAHKLVLFACSPYFKEVLKVKKNYFSLIHIN